MEIHIRAAASQDYEQVEQIMRQVHTLHVGWRPDIYRDVETVMPRALFAELVSMGELLVSVADGRVIGLAAFQERKVSGGPFVPRITLFVNDLAVLEGYRGRGVGRALLNRVAQIARERNLDGVELQVNARNENAMRMYKTLGFMEKSINMELLF